MTPFWQFPAKSLRKTILRDTRLRDLDNRIGAFLAQKEHDREACSDVIDNIKGRRTRIRGEMRTLRDV